MRQIMTKAIDDRIAAHLDVCRNSDPQSNHLAYAAWREFHSLECSADERADAKQLYVERLLALTTS